MEKTDKSAVEEPITTLKIKAVPSMNEKEYAQYCYDIALKDMLNNPKDPRAREAFEKANAHLFEVQDAYRIAIRLLMERSRRLKAATSHLIRLRFTRWTSRG